MALDFEKRSEHFSKIISNDERLARFIDLCFQSDELSLAQASEAFNQNEKLREVRTYDGWRQVKRYVQRGQHGYPTFDPTTKNEKSFVFDVSQTAGVPRPKRVLSGEEFDRIYNEIAEVSQIFCGEDIGGMRSSVQKILSIKENKNQEEQKNERNIRDLQSVGGGREWTSDDAVLLHDRGNHGNRGVPQARKGASVGRQISFFDGIEAESGAVRENGGNVSQREQLPQIHDHALASDAVVQSGGAGGTDREVSGRNVFAVQSAENAGLSHVGERDEGAPANGRGKDLRRVHQAVRKGLNDQYARYAELAKANPDTVLMLRIGDFYETLGDKALVMSNALSLTLTSRDVGLPERVPMVGIPFHALDNYVKKLKSKGISCIIGDNLEELEEQAVNLQSIAKAQGFERTIAAEQTVEPSPGEAAVQGVQTQEETGGSAKTNYTMTEVDFAVRPPLQRIRDNIEAIRLVKRIKGECRMATATEKSKLAKYVGWGGLADIFDDRKSNLETEREELKELLTKGEYLDARASVLSSFYTQKDIVDGIYAGLERLGVKDAHVLEPSCGTGNFIGCAPKELNLKFNAVELDAVSTDIARALYPEARITNQSYEEAAIADSTYDVVVGNVPFGNFSVSDSRYDKFQLKIHDYFLVKSMDKLRAGGIMAVITSSGTLDKKDDSARRYLAERGELLVAFRLPNTAFKGNAGTEAVTDILFFRKREKREPANAEWLKSAYRDDSAEDPVNEYFIKHPENVLGEMKTISGRYGNTRTIVPHEGNSLREELLKAIARLPENIYTTQSNQTATPEEEAEEEEQNYLQNGERNFDFCIRNGKAFIRFNNHYELPTAKALQGSLSGKMLKQLQAYIQLREQTMRIIELQAMGCSDDELKIGQETLHGLYDDFVKEYGCVSAEKNYRLLKDDNDYSLVSALELYDKETDTAEKSSIFYQRTLNKAERKTHTDDVNEALALSRNYLGRVDIPYIGKLTGKKENEVLSALGDTVFQNITPELLMNVNADVRYDGFQAYDEYLSGNVVKKLNTCKTLLSELEGGKLMISDVVREDIRKRLEKNIGALTKVLPKKLSNTDIRVRMGATWIDGDDYWRFFEHLTGQRVYRNDGDGVQYNNHNGEYVFHAPSYCRHTTSMTSEWGTQRMDGVDIFSCALNNQMPSVYDKVIEDGKEKRVLNKAETALAREKLRAMQTEFKSWLWEHPARVDKYEKVYNERFNNIVLPQYRGAHLSFEDMNLTISLREHQRAAVERIATGNNVLLHHSVGAGKTFEMIAGARKLREYGIAKKPLFVVPNAIIGQWARDAKTLYPNAKVLVSSKEDFEKDKRKRFISKIATGDWDMVIIAESQFVKIPVSGERQLAKLEEQKLELEISLRDEKAKQWRGGSSLTVKSLEQAKKAIEAKTKKVLADIEKRQDKVLNFEQLGVDYLFVDEAHGYKNKELITHMTNVAGISSNGSQKAFDLEMKIDYLRELHGGDKGVVFATGTPISNSMAEMYTMQSYLSKGQLQEAGIEHFDAWASTFGETVAGWELKASGDGVKPRTRFSRFVNLPELQMMYRTFADVKTSEMLNLPVPKYSRHTVIVEPTEQIRAFNDEIVKRGEAIECGGVDPKVDNMLKLTSDGKKLALDPRCYSGTAHDDENTKVNECVKNVYDIYLKGESERTTQVIFCDQSVPKQDEWNVYEDIKQKLVALGVKDEEIAFAQSAKTDEEKNKIYDALNAGEIRVLIGSTMKCGVGANFQKRLKALHHLDVPYRPSDMEQREGRIIRQGNTNAEVDIYSYITERTFDSYSYQILENKQRFISQINNGDMSIREAADIDETTLSYAQIKAIATANPDFVRQMQLISSIKELKMLKSKHYQEQAFLKSKLEFSIPQELAHESARRAAMQEDMQSYSEAVTLKIGSKAIEKLGDEEAEIFTKAYGAAKSNDVIGELNGMKLVVKKDGAYGSIMLSGAGDYPVSLGDSGRGNLTKILNTYERLPKVFADVCKHIDVLEQEKEECRRQLEKPFGRDEELSAQEKELESINSRLEADKDVIIDEEEAVSIPQEIKMEQKSNADNILTKEEENYRE